MFFMFEKQSNAIEHARETSTALRALWRVDPGRGKALFVTFDHQAPPRIEGITAVVAEEKVRKGTRHRP
jgi:hypothetical protein